MSKLRQWAYILAVRLAAWPLSWASAGVVRVIHKRKLGRYYVGVVFAFDRAEVLAIPEWKRRKARAAMIELFKFLRK